MVFGGHAGREEKSDNNTRSVKVENSSQLCDIIVYSGTILLDKYLSKKSVYQATLLWIRPDPSQIFNVYLFKCHDI